MLLPLSAQVDPLTLLGKRAYIYGKAAPYFVKLKSSHGISAARITRHVKPFNCLDLELHSSFSDVMERVQVSAVGLRLVNPADRHARPWWVDTARKHKADMQRRRGA